MPATQGGRPVAGWVAVPFDFKINQCPDGTHRGVKSPMSDSASLFLVNATFVLLVAASALTWAIVIVKLLQSVRSK